MTAPVIIDCEQNTPEWYAARAGIPTASMFATVMAKGRGSAPSKTRRTYMLKLAGEIISGAPMDSYSNAHMERGHILEPEARALYAFMHDADPQQVGFVRNGITGCSPDSLIGEHGMLEIKTKLPHLLIDCILKDQFPLDHVHQCQGQLMVTEREWIDIMVYYPGMPPFIKRAERDEDFIDGLKDALMQFVHELEEVVQAVREYAP